MRPEIFELAFVTIAAVTDNALLAGLLLPSADRVVRSKILWLVGGALAIIQIALAGGVGKLLAVPIFRSLAIVVLVWMAVRTITYAGQQLRSFVPLSAAFKVLLYALLGNLDNMIWVGMSVRHHYVWLAAFTLASVPWFVWVAMFLGDQCQRYPWIMVAGAGMMAWAAATLWLNTSTSPMFQYMPYGTFHILFAVGVVGLGLGLRHLRLRRAR